MIAPFFDTNIVIDWLIDRAGASDELAQYDRHRISRVAWAEVLAGEPAESREKVKILLRAFEIVEVDEQIAATAADIRHDTRMKLLDAFILATARVNGAILVTRDVKAFRPDMPGIRVPYIV